MTTTTQQQQELYQLALSYISRCSPNEITLNDYTTFGSLYISLFDTEFSERVLSHGENPEIISLSLKENKPALPLPSQYEYDLEVKVGSGDNKTLLLQRQEKGKTSALGVAYEATKTRVQNYQKQDAEEKAVPRMLKALSELEKKLHK